MGNFLSTITPWVQVLQALLVPIIAIFGTWIAYWQMRIARAKLRHDLFDRRYRVFDISRKMLLSVNSTNGISDEIYREFALGISDAQFLFQADLFDYLTEMRQRVAKLKSITSVKEMISDRHEQLAASNAAGENLI